MKKQKLAVERSKIKTRVTWGFSPVTRVVPSKKRYTRKNRKSDLLDYI